MSQKVNGISLIITGQYRQLCSLSREIKLALLLLYFECNLNMLTDERRLYNAEKKTITDY